MTSLVAFTFMLVIASAPMQHVPLSYASVDSGVQAGECALPQSSSPASPSNQSGSLALEERVWISVRVIDMSEASWWVAHDNDDPNAVPQSVIQCTPLTANKLEQIPKVAAAIVGADGCKDGVEVCELPSGVSYGGEQQYRLSMSKEEARSIAEEVRIVENMAVLEHDGRYYFLQLYTTDEDVGTQARVEFLDPHFANNASKDDRFIRLEKGQSVTIPFTLRTFATFGMPANITLVAGVNAQDSGVAASIEPSSFMIPERSTAEANLTIFAGANAQDGVYQFFMAGKDGSIRTCGFYTDYDCPSVQIGDSIWQINTGDGGIGLGGKDPPRWLRLTTETDKASYRMGETVTIESYIENVSNETITLEGIRLVVDIGNKTVYEDPNSSTTALNNLYAIDAYSYNGDDTITVQPHSRVLLVRPFYWNQELGSSFLDGPEVTPSVQEGNYTIRVSLAGYEGTVMYDNKNIKIIAAPDGDEVVMVPETAWIVGSAQLPFIVGAGVAIAGIIAFVTLRSKK